MKKLIVVASIVLISNVLGYFQQYHCVAECVYADEHCAEFMREDGNIYAWEGDGFEVGHKYKLNMFDFENFDVTDDAIVSVGKEVQ